MASGVGEQAFGKLMNQVFSWKKRQSYCSERGGSDREKLNAKSSGEKPELCG